MAHRQRSRFPSEQYKKQATWCIFWIAAVQSLVGMIMLLGSPFDLIVYLATPLCSFFVLVLFHTTVGNIRTALAAFLLSSLYIFLGIRLRQSSKLALLLALVLFLLDSILILPAFLGAGGEVPMELITLLGLALVLPRLHIIRILVAGLIGNYGPII